jgi:hypothetical protein
MGKISRAKSGVGNGSEAGFSTTLSMDAHAQKRAAESERKRVCFCRYFAKPSSGLEPETPSLPWNV